MSHFTSSLPVSVAGFEAAHGYFELYESLSEITDADFLQVAGQLTPVMACLGGQMMAVRFCTHEGELDLLHPGPSHSEVMWVRAQGAATLAQLRWRPCPGQPMTAEPTVLTCPLEGAIGAEHYPRWELVAQWAGTAPKALGCMTLNRHGPAFMSLPALRLSNAAHRPQAVRGVRHLATQRRHGNCWLPESSLSPLAGRTTGSAMHIEIHTTHQITPQESLKATVAGWVEHALDRFASRITDIDVHLDDENGPKGGAKDIRCTMQAQVPGHAPVVVTAHAANVEQASHAALAKMTHALDSALGREATLQHKGAVAAEEMLARSDSGLQ